MIIMILVAAIWVFLKFGPDGDISANAGFGGGPSTTGASGGDAGKKRMDAEE
jgi:hypothetical protein